MRHHFTLAYCPWSNGTIEVVNRVLVRIFRSLLSELKLGIEYWSGIQEPVQSVLNHSPADKWDGFTAGTVFTQIPAVQPISMIAHPRTQKEVSLAAVIQRQKDALKEAQEALEGMHRIYDERNGTKRDKRRARLNKDTHKQAVRFDIGDYVLIAKIHTKFISKLSVRWLGPARVVGALNEWTFEIEDLRDESLSTHHASRLRLYHDASLNVTTALLEEIAHAAGSHLVDRILYIQKNPQATWEPL